MKTRLQSVFLTVLVVGAIVAAGVTPAAAQTGAGNVSAVEYSVSETTVEVDEPVTVTATLENTGDANASTTVSLAVDGETVETRNASVEANGTDTVTFETSFEAAGEYAVAVDGLEPTTVVVESGPPANESGTLSGTVTDADTGEPIADASVAVEGTNHTATTGPNGSYTLAELPLGAHDVEADADGYEPSEREVTVAANGTATGDFALSAEEPAVTSDRVDVVLEGAPAGLQTYGVTVTVDADASIEGVESELLSGEKVQVLDRTDDSITFRAADLGDSVSPSEDDLVLGTVELTGEVAEEQATVTVDELVDDDGAEMNESRVRVALAGVLFVEPLPGSAAGAPPADLDGDGLYEDVDGDGTADFADAITLAFVDHGELSADQRAALDFNGDGDLTFGDAIELAFRV